MLTIPQLVAPKRSMFSAGLLKNCLQNQRLFPRSNCNHTSTHIPGFYSVKTSFVIFGLLLSTACATFSQTAEQNVSVKPDSSVPIQKVEPTPYAVTKRDANSRVWERTTYEK